MYVCILEGHSNTLNKPLFQYTYTKYFPESILKVGSNLNIFLILCRLQKKKRKVWLTNFFNPSEKYVL